jgi:hypothetical protein
MTPDRDIQQLLDVWLADGPFQVADRVIDETAARIARQRQRPAWRLQPWRFPTMSTPFRLALVGAALVAALLGGSMLIGGGAPRATPTPSPTTSATSSIPPSATPSPTAPPSQGPRALTSDAKGPGTFVGAPFEGKPLTWTVTLPDGWFGYDSWALGGPASPLPEPVIVIIAENWTIPADSCHAAGSTPATSTATFLAALAKRGDWHPSKPVSTTIGGFAAKRVDFELPVDVTVCGGSSDTYIVFAEAADGTGFHAQGSSNRWSVWVVDVPGRGPVYIARDAFPGTPAAQVSAADAIVASIQIAP